MQCVPENVAAELQVVIVKAPMRDTQDLFVRAPDVNATQYKADDPKMEFAKACEIVFCDTGNWMDVMDGNDAYVITVVKSTKYFRNSSR